MAWLCRLLRRLRSRSCRQNRQLPPGQVPSCWTAGVMICVFLLSNQAHVNSSLRPPLTAEISAGSSRHLRRPRSKPAVACSSAAAGMCENWSQCPNRSDRSKLEVIERREYGPRGWPDWGPHGHVAVRPLGQPLLDQGLGPQLAEQSKKIGIAQSRQCCALDAWHPRNLSRHGREGGHPSKSTMG